MALSSRIQNLRKNPVVSRENLHEVTAKMMGQKSVTDSVKKVLRKTGHYYGSRRLNKQQYGQALKDVSEHLEKEKGTKQTYFARKIRESLRKGKGLVRGGTAEKVFHSEVKEQISAGEPTEMNPEIKNRLRTKLMQGKRLTQEDIEGVPEEELDKLKLMVKSLQRIHQRERAEEIEKETQGETDEKKIQPEEARSSAISYEEEKDQGDQKSTTAPTSKSQSTVPLQGGIGTEARPEGNLERFSANIGTGKPADEESSETPLGKEKPSPSEEEDTEISDMEIG